MRKANLFLMLVLSTGALKADIIYNNFLASDPSYDGTAGLFIQNASGQLGLAFAFQTPDYDTYVTNIRLAVTFISGDPDTTPAIDLGIAPDLGGVPGAVVDLQTLALNALPDGDTGNYLSEIVSYTPTMTDVLLRNSTYWVVAIGADPSSQLRWDFNMFGDSGGINDVYAKLLVDDSTTPSTELWKPGTYTQGAFQVNANIVPEPGTITMLGAGLLVIGFGATRRRLHN
jgi:PEP-CTERM motif